MPPRQQSRLTALGIGRLFNIVLDMQHRTTCYGLSHNRWFWLDRIKLLRPGFIKLLRDLER
ncbi:hypothetical protein D3C76_1809080 [compost metagenome]